MQPWQVPFLGQHELPSELTAFELSYFFSFNDAERLAIQTRRRPLNQLGAAVHLGFMKMSGCALDAFEMVPRSLLTHLGDALGIEVPTVTSVRALYRRRATLFEHQRWAAEMLGFRPTSEHQRRALTGLIKQESYKALSAAQLVTFARCWCYERKLLIPGERTLNDLVRTAIPQAEQELLDAVEKGIPAAQRSQWLEALGALRSGKRSVLEWLQGEPGKPSRQTLAGQLAYVDFLKGLAVHRYPLEMVRLEHQKQLAQRIRRRRPARWQTLKEPRRTLEAVCFLRVTLLQKTDALIALIDRDIMKRRRQTVEKVRKGNMALGISLKHRVQQLQSYAREEGRTLEELRQGIAELLPGSQEPSFASQAAETRYRMTDDARAVRQLVRALLTLDVEGAPGNPLIEAVGVLRKLHERGARHLPESVDCSFAPLWSVAMEGPDRQRALRGFETAILFELRKGLRNGSIWVSYSLSYRHREQLLIPSDAWRQERNGYYRRLKLPVDPQQYIAKYTQQLEDGLEQVAEAVRTGVIAIEQDELALGKLEAEPTSPHVEPVRDALFAAVGSVQLPELIMEVDSQTRFSSALLGREPRSWQELLTLYGALLAHGTDMSAAAVSLMIPQITATAISDCMRLLEDATALRSGNDGCVAFIRQHPVTQCWGEGTLASSDSMSLDATRHLFSARTDPRRQRRGIGIYTHKLDQWPLIYDQPVVLMQRQAGAAIEGMVRQRASAELERVAVDSHGFTAFGMGVAKALHRDLCPRLRGMGQRRLHVPRGMPVPDILEPVIVRDISMEPIGAGWDDFVRLVASVEAGTLSGLLALERFGADSRADPVHTCGSALGRLFLSIFLCDFVSNESFRRELLRVLDRGEATHRLLRAIYYGNIPATRGRRREELSAISGSLTLLSNITMAWMTHHMQGVLDRWKRDEGRRIERDILRHIGPARFEGVNFRGKFDFPLSRYQERLLPKTARLHHGP
jgi:TnpA family transposase